MLRKRPVPDLIRDGYRLSDKIMLKQEDRARWRFEEKSSCANSGLNYLLATLLDFAAARSLSITARQPVLRLALFLYIQAVIFGMLGISELQRRNASPVHISCASALKAKPWVEDSAEIETAKASTKPAWRILVANAVIVG